jgi:hypothetical protein
MPGVGLLKARKQFSYDLGFAVQEPNNVAFSRNVSKLRAGIVGDLRA